MVRRIFLFGAVLGAGLLLAVPSRAQQQDNSSQAQQKPSQKQSESQKKDQKKSTAPANPFPQAKSEAAARQAQQEGNPPAAPAPQTAPNGKPSTADRNPFPEAESERAAHQNQENQNPQNQDQQESGAGRSGFSSSQVKGLDLPTQGNAPVAKPRYNPELAKQDNKVGTFYLQTGDWKGAYERFLEASQVDPGSAEAVWGLAESAAHLGKRDEALKNFALYLNALPDGPHAKDIRKEMKKMGVDPPQ